MRHAVGDARCAAFRLCRAGADSSRRLQGGALVMDALGPQSVPRLPRGVRLSHDQACDRWLLLAPERIFEPNDVALAVLRLVDGERSVQAICEELGPSYNADPALIMADVVELLGGFV